jgi:type VI secretion system protein ImpD
MPENARTSSVIYETEPASGSVSAGERADAAVGTFLDQFLRVGDRKPVPRDSLARFLRAGTVGEALDACFGGDSLPDRDEILDVLNRTIALIDGLLRDQINEILHHPRFQALEAAWRGLAYLIDCTDPDAPGKAVIRMLDCSHNELFRDLDRAIEFDQSQIFQKIYEEEFGMPGGRPYGLLIGNYEFSSHPDDLSTLTKMSRVAAAAFAPFVCAASPELLDLESFADLERVYDLSSTFDVRVNPQYVSWHSLRASEDARFVGMVIPRLLLRRPYHDDPSRRDGFLFSEAWSRVTPHDYLWGNGAFGLGEVTIRAFQRSGWLANIRGVDPGEETGGLVSNLPAYWFETDSPGVLSRPVTDIVVTEMQEKMLSEAGFTSLCSCPGTHYAAFYTCPSIQKPKQYDTEEATANARISAMLQYMLCVSLFARSLKVMVRDRVGSFAEANECETFLNRWIKKYVTPDDDASPEVKARHPLREARIEVRPHASKPGYYLCTAHLQPHFELEDLSAAVQLQTEILAHR